MRSPLPLTVTQTPPPEQAAPPSRATAPVFSSASVGYAAGRANPQAPGVADPAIIARTTDRGRTWERVWTSIASGTTLTYLGLAPGSGGFVYAAGEAGAPSGQPVLVVSGDGGVGWHVVKPALRQTPLAPIPPGPLDGRPAPALAEEVWPSPRFQFVSAMVGFAGFNPMVDQGNAVDEAPQVLVTRDGGRTWRWLPLPPGLTAFTGGHDFPTASDREARGNPAAARAHAWPSAAACGWPPAWVWGVGAR